MGLEGGMSISLHSSRIPSPEIGSIGMLGGLRSVCRSRCLWRDLALFIRLRFLMCSFFVSGDMAAILLRGGLGVDGFE